tara:strand:- start:1703 stop:2701 length:999 start_codon:yes stop_codon:yes gene_type:complete
MATTIQRTIYTGTNVFVDPEGNLTGWNSGGAGGTTGIVWVNTAQNATFNLNIPRADINVFGVTGVIDRPQLEAETATFEFGMIPNLATPAAVYNKTLIADDLDALIADAIAETPVYVTAGAPKVGAVKKALMNSLTGEATVGALANFTLSFTGATHTAANPAYTGVTAQYDDDGTYTNVAVGATGLTAKASVVTPQQVVLTQGGAGNDGSNGALVDEAMPDGDSDNITESCAQSASFSWDVPVETVLCLGSDPTSDGIALGNPPGSSSFTVEALAAQLVGQGKQDYKLTLGAYNFAMSGGNIDSRTHSLAVGDLYGSYNYVIGGTGDGFVVT